MPTLNEVDENLFRNLLVRIREEDLERFRTICIESLTTPMADESVSITRIRDDRDSSVSAIIIACRGTLVSQNTSSLFTTHASEYNLHLVRDEIPDPETPDAD